MNNSFFTRKLYSAIIIFILTISSGFAATTQENNWTIAAGTFTYTRKQNDAVSVAAASMFPTGILEKLNTLLYREVDYDERNSRDLYDLQKQRQSLILQLSAEVKKRDAIVVSNYSASDFKKNLKKEEDAIKDIKTKIDENIQEQEKLESELEKAKSESTVKNDSSKEETSEELQKMGSFVKNFFSSKAKFYEPEQIKLYKDDITSLYEPDKNSIFAGYTSKAMEKEMVSKNINAFITGSITAYDEYLTLTVDLYVYPGAKKACTITEAGSLRDSDFLCTAIAQQLIPAITNAMPVQLYIEVKNEENIDVDMYMDDVFQDLISSDATISSGIHYLQFSSPGYKTIETNYNFRGNRTYKIDIKLEKNNPGTMLLGVKSPLDGKIYANGRAVQEDENKIASITIDGNPVLGQFVDSMDNSKTAFYYISKKNLNDNMAALVTAKPLNHSDYIETRRKWMYTSYSALITSLVPTFVCIGQVTGYNNAAKLDYITENSDIRKANAWIIATNICEGVSIACGVWLCYELFRYFTAANTVLPSEKVRKMNEKSELEENMKEINNKRQDEKEKILEKQRQNEEKTKAEKAAADKKTEEKSVEEADGEETAVEEAAAEETDAEKENKAGNEESAAEEKASLEKSEVQLDNIKNQE